MTTTRKKKTAIRTEFGDWQTPLDLARRVCLVASTRISPSMVVEPNCGQGAFLRAATAAFPQASRFLGLDINADYVRAASSIENQSLTVLHQDFFTFDWKRCLSESSGPILVIGNPPWVTNAELMRMGSRNVPEKSNIHDLNGIDAVTGKSNFDISEWMLIREVESLRGKDALLAMLCKTAIARKVIAHAWKNDLPFADAEIREIDAQRYFDVAVDACLLLVRLQPEADSPDSPCRVFDSLDSEVPSYVLGLRHGRLASRVDVVDKYSSLIGEKRPLFHWRSGIKHDCSKVMELTREPDGSFVNGFEERIDLEPDIVFPMLKSSDLANGKIESIRRYMLVPQRAIGDDTKFIALEHSKTWRYLTTHATRLDKRKSTIYRGKPRFSIFGIGEYSFAPWKVAVSGLYKSLKFRVVGPHEGRPVVLDDTCYFLAFQSEEEASLVKKLLDSPVCGEILGAFVFWDSKRPITKEILALVNLREIASFLGQEEAFRKTFSRLLSSEQTTFF
ncbi:MAG: SAM-dependent DNA methyltransferase [Pirellulaceae bacterium]|nr:SAM-dependent DNA methyltransferase [Pirellulaceae bacterium]